MINLLAPFPLLSRRLLFLALAFGTGALVLIILSPIGLNLLAGSLLMPGIVTAIVVSTLALCGSMGIPLLAPFNPEAEAERYLEAGRARLAAERARALAQLEAEKQEFTTQLEAKKAQLIIEKAQIEAKSAELATREAEVKIKSAELEVKAVEADTQLAQTETVFKQLTVEQRRFKAWTKRMESEKVQFEDKLVELKTIHGETFPPELRETLAKDLLEALKAEDAPLMRTMFSNPFGFTEAPKPLKQPDNPLHRVLEQSVAEGILEEDVLDDEEVICSITHQVMQDPVKGEDGRRYDRFCLENIYYAVPGVYPFNRQAMMVDPAELPRDQACYAKIQNLAKRCQTALTTPPQAEESNYSTPGLLT